jgi:putative NIF3 family GTP cyclohydrolase 1 type 2
VRHTAMLGRMVRTVAICGGSGSFLLPEAIRAGANAFVTADFKYHEFFDADGHLVIADIGHFESEQFTIELLYSIIREKFPTFALHLTKLCTNPVHYI